MTATNLSQPSEAQKKKQPTCTDNNGKPIMRKDREGKVTDKPVTVTDGRITAIVQNMEKMISFSWGQFRFVDSYAFLSSSSRQAGYKYSQEDLSFTRQRFPASQVDLMTRKGVYPYEYMDSFDRFDEKELPTQVIH